MSGKKPAIDRSYPPSPAAWGAVVETLELLTGRRGDAISTPALTQLTFSNPPTQAEVTALYQYVNRQRAALEALLTRLNS
jgi:hypothetical protein